MDLKALIAKLNPTCRRALEGAAQMCVAQTNFNVEAEHLLFKLLEPADTDIRRLLRYYDIEVEDVKAELTRSIEKFTRGSGRTPALSPQIPLLIQEAWVVSSLYLGAYSVRSAGVLQAIMEHESLRVVITESAPSILRIPRDKFREDVRDVIKGSAEDKPLDPATAPPEVMTPPPPHHAEAKPRSAAESKTPALDQYTIDLTAQARAGKIDPVQGRDVEIRQIIDILTRRRQNNPILTGDAGVGKTAVVEGFALRIATNDVPPPLQNISLHILDLGLLQAGAGVKGEFENRLKSVIAEVKSSPHPIILFIDEAHTMIGAGGPSGSGDAANLLKPALARGELRTIAATTWSEYKKYFEKDAALARRFQVIQVDEPTEELALEMLRGVAGTLEKHHNVRILDEAIHDAVVLSNRYITGRKLPDKAVSVLDTACARVAIAQTSNPAAIEGASRRIDRLEEEIVLLKREQLTGRNHSERLEELGTQLSDAQKTKDDLIVRWKQEMELFRQITTMQKDLEGKGEQPAREGLPALEQLKKQLSDLQKDEPMVPIHVGSSVIASVVSGWTGIPVGKMVTDEIRGVLALKERMEERVVGQAQALDAICRRIRTSRADLVDPGKPVGVFLLAGPSGVGKTETAITLADLLYGGENNMVVVNMSEYQEAHTVSSLKGAPPGYVGFGTGGVLTEAVRRDPYTVVLLDEVEKAHPDVMELFYQVFDKGTLEDGEGVVVDFKNTVIILTSNIGSEVVMRACRDPKNLPPLEQIVEMIRPELLQHFRPSLLGRLVIVPYYPLGDEHIKGIVRLKLGKIQQRFRDNHRATLTYDAALVDSIAARCTEVDSGARNVDHILTNTLLPEVSAEVLQRMADGESFSAVHVSLDPAGDLNYRFS